MKTQTLIIFMILSLSNATFLRGPNPATGIANPNFIIPKIEQMIASLSNFRKSIASRPQKSFLRFDAGDEEDDISPLLNAMDSIQGYVANLNEDYTGFFDMNDLLLAEKNIRDNLSTFRNVNDGLSEDMLVTLGDALMKLEFVRNDVKTMIGEIKEGIDGVNQNFEQLEEQENMSPEIMPDKAELQPEIFIGTVEQLDQVLLNSIETTEKSVEQQKTAKFSLIELNVHFSGMIFQLKQARDADSPYMHNTLQEWLKANGMCVLPCIGLAWGMILTAFDCANCLYNMNSVLEAQKQKIVNDLLAVTKSFNDLISSVETYAELGAKLQETAESQIDVLSTFNVEITTMESRLKGYKGYMEKVRAEKVHGQRVMIVKMMAPLAKVCEELQDKFLKS